MKITRKPIKIITFSIIGIAILLIAYYSVSKLKKSTVSELNTNKAVSYVQARLIESMGLPELSIDFNNPPSNLSDQARNAMKQLVDATTLSGDGTDKTKDQQAVTAVSKLIQQNPEYSDAYMLKVTLQLMAGEKGYSQMLSDIDKAIEYRSSKKIESTNSTDAPLLSLRAKVDILTGDEQAAINDLEKAINIDPSSTNDVFNTGGVKPEDNSNPASIQKVDLDALIAKFPDDYRPLLFRGLFYKNFATFGEEYYTSTLNDLQQALKKNPNSALVNYELGDAGASMTFLTKAGASDISNITGSTGGYRDLTNQTVVNYAKEAIRLDPKFAPAYSLAAEALHELKRDAEAVPYYDKLIELDPNDAGAYSDRGLAKELSNDITGAISDYTKAVELKKTGTTSNDTYLENTYENRAQAYIKAKNLDSAIADYNNAIGITFSQQVFLMSLGQIRSIYPELASISDQDLLAGLRQKYYPDMTQDNFSGNYKSDKKPLEDFVLAGLYASRGDVYLAKGNFKKAAGDYGRAIHDYSKYTPENKWKTIFKDSIAEYSIDVQTMDFSQADIASLWLQTKYSDDTQNSIQNNYQVDCYNKKIKSLESTFYNSAGDAVSSKGEGEWQSISPGTVSEVLFKGMCTN